MVCSAVLKSTMKIVGSTYRESAGIAADAIFVPLEDNNSEEEKKGWKGEERKAGEDSRAEKIQWERSGSRARAKLPIASQYIESRTRCLTFDKKKKKKKGKEFRPNFHHAWDTDPRQNMMNQSARLREPDCTLLRH